MSETQTGSEPIKDKNQIHAEPEVAADDGAPKAEPSTQETKEGNPPLTDEQALEDLQSDISEPVKTETRKIKAIKKSIKEYNEVLGEDDSIDFALLAQKVEKNPKGLESFAKEHNYDLVELQRELELETRPFRSKEAERIEELEAELENNKAIKKRDELASTIKELVAAEGDITLSDFHAQVGEDFKIYMKGLQAEGESVVDAAKKAFAKVKANLNPTAEKDALLKNLKKQPLGKVNTEEKEIKLAKAIDVNNPELYTTEERIAYKKKYMQPNNVVKYL